MGGSTNQAKAAKMVAIALLFAAVAAKARTPLNIVHIISDDLRLERTVALTASRGAHTPNIDALASTGVVFDRAYAQQAVCGPSRNSFLSGRRPDASKSWNFINW